MRAGALSRRDCRREARHRRAMSPDAIRSSGRSLRLGKSTIVPDTFGRLLMLPASNLPVASLLIPLTWTHSFGSSRRNSLLPDRTASGPRAGPIGSESQILAQARSAARCLSWRAFDRAEAGY